MKSRSLSALVPVAVAAACVVLSLGILAGVALTRPQAPESIAPSGHPTSVMAREVRTADEHGVTVKVTTGSSAKLVSRTAGTVTRSDCVPGETVSSGAGGVAINDATIISLATSQPLWRDLATGDTGADVRSLQAELSRLGYVLEVDGRFGASTLKAVTELARSAGAGDARSWQSFRSSRFVWLPAPSVTIASCDAQVGTELTAQGVLATLPPRITAAVVRPLPTDAMPGRRIIVAGDLSIPVDATGSVASPDDLDRLAASPAYRDHASADPSPAGEADTGSTTSGTRDGLSVRYRLADPLTVFAVPAAAVSSTGEGVGCVLDQGRPRPVTILGSQLGETFVTPLEHGKLTSISVQAPKAGCR